MIERFFWFYLKANIEDDEMVEDNSCDDVLPVRDVFDIDELSLSICREKPEDILVSCPFCTDVTSLPEVGRHCQTVHRLSKFTCPGRKCPNRIQVPLNNSFPSVLWFLLQKFIYDTISKCTCACNLNICLVAILVYIPKRPSRVTNNF